METPNYRKGSIIFDDDTILQVEQRGGGGSGVGGETGLAAVNLKTGESTNAALAAKDETIAEQAATIETQAATIIELQEELAEVPTIEALNVTANGTYNEDGKAYKPVVVNVPGGLDVSPLFTIRITNNTANTVGYGGINIAAATPEIILSNRQLAPNETVDLNTRILQKDNSGVFTPTIVPTTAGSISAVTPLPSGVTFNARHSLVFDFNTFTGGVVALSIN